MDAIRRLRHEGRYAEAEAAVRQRLAADPADAWGQAALRDLLFLQGRAVLPADPLQRLVLARQLAGTLGPAALRGADEGPRLDQAAAIVCAELQGLPREARLHAYRVLWAVGDYGRAEALGGLAELMVQAADADDPILLLSLLARVRSDADRQAALEAHSRWGRRFEAPPVEIAARAGGKRRIGFLSSDLRRHVVGFFLIPLFEWIPVNVELFVYSSHPGPADEVERWFATRSTWRRLPAEDEAAARLIAADGLDVLIEVGGPTGRARPGVLARRPARRLISWMGYPHSLGVPAVDGFLGDPHLLPDGRWILERPLHLPASWVCMAPAFFSPDEPLAAEPPCLRGAGVTFGSASDVFKLNPPLLRAWARILAATPGSRLLIVRPEAGARVFQQNLRAFFAAEGVEADRIAFRPERGAVRAAYADIDIALDTFPLNGGTTTCEALWSGVPVVSLTGSAPYERMGLSILANAGLPDLAATSVDGYVRAAVELAGDPARLGELRRGLRGGILASPLGQPPRFALDFYSLMAEL